MATEPHSGDTVFLARTRPILGIKGLGLLEGAMAERALTARVKGIGFDLDSAR